jgi:hypothetical protein
MRSETVGCRSTNFFVADTLYPGVTTSVVNHDEVEFRV